MIFQFRPFVLPLVILAGAAVAAFLYWKKLGCCSCCCCHFLQVASYSGSEIQSHVDFQTIWFSAAWIIRVWRLLHMSIHTAGGNTEVAKQWAKFLNLGFRRKQKRCCGLFDPRTAEFLHFRANCQVGNRELKKFRNSRAFCFRSFHFLNVLIFIL